eukprot:186387_1
MSLWEKLVGSPTDGTAHRAYFYIATTAFIGGVSMYAAEKTGLWIKYPRLFPVTVISALWVFYDHIGDIFVYTKQLDRMRNNIFWIIHPAVALYKINKNGENFGMSLAYELFYKIVNVGFGMFVDYKSTQIIWNDKRIDEKKK